MTDTSSPTTTDSVPLYLRKVSLLVQLGNTVLDLSDFKIEFQTFAPEATIPSSAVIRVFNLSKETVGKITGPTPAGSSGQASATSFNGVEFKLVTLSAGYQVSPFGLIFYGTIKQTRRGRLNATDTYIELLCSDGDVSHNWGFVNTTLAAGANGAQDQANAVNQANQAVDPNAGAGDQSGITGGGGAVNALTRGKVMFGQTRDFNDDIAKSNDCFWYYSQGKLNFTKRTAYKAGQVVILNAKSGLIGQPEQTEGGIVAESLLNPAIVAGVRVQINNGDINVTENQPGNTTLYNDQTQPFFIPDVSADGIYRVFVAEHVGDTRGNEWYTRLTLLTVDPSIAAGAPGAIPGGM